MTQHQQFFYKEDGDFAVGPQLPLDQYLAAVKRLVRYANDIILVDSQGNFLLPTRKADKSAAGLWFFGGQVAAFTSLSDSLIQTLKREAGLTLTADRFTHLAQTRMWFNGHEGFMHDALSDIFVVHVTDEEIASVQVDTTEYEDRPLHACTLKDFEVLKDGVAKKVLIDMWNLFHQSLI